MVFYCHANYGALTWGLQHCWKAIPRARQDIVKKSDFIDIFMSGIERLRRYSLDTVQITQGLGSLPPVESAHHRPVTMKRSVSMKDL